MRTFYLDRAKYHEEEAEKLSGSADPSREEKVEAHRYYARQCRLLAAMFQ